MPPSCPPMPSAQVLQALRLLIARHIFSQPTRLASRSEYQIAFQPPPLFMVFMAESLASLSGGRQQRIGVGTTAVGHRPTAFGRAKLVLPGIGRTATIRAISTGGSVVMVSGLQNRYSQKSAALQRDRRVFAPDAGSVRHEGNSVDDRCSGICGGASRAVVGFADGSKS